MTDEKRDARSRRPGKRSRLFTARLSENEAELVEQIVARTGLSAAALVRRALLDAPPSHRRPSTEDRAVVRLMSALGKIASNVHQLADHAHQGSFDADTAESIDYAVRDLAELRFACMQVLGYEQEDSGEGDEGADLDE